MALSIVDYKGGQVAVSSAASLTLPGGAPNAGDLLVCITGSSSSTAPTIGTGWFTYQSRTSAPQGYILYKICGPGESATQSPFTNNNTGTSMQTGMWRITGSSSSPFDSFSITFGASANPATVTDTVTVNASGCVTLGWIQGSSAQTWGVPSGWTSKNAFGSALVAQFNGSPTPGSFSTTWTGSATGSCTGIVVNIAPAPPTPTKLDYKFLTTAAGVLGSLTLPNGAPNQGDLLVATCSNGGSVFPTVQSDWTFLASNSPGVCFTIAYKICGASESATQSPFFNNNGASGLNTAIRRFSGVNTAAPIDSFKINKASTATTVTNTFTVNQAGTYSVGHYQCNVSGQAFTVPQGWFNDTTAAGYEIAEAPYLFAPGSNSVVWTSSISASVVAGVINIAPSIPYPQDSNMFEDGTERGKNRHRIAHGFGGSEITEFELLSRDYALYEIPIEMSDTSTQSRLNRHRIPAGFDSTDITEFETVPSTRIHALLGSTTLGYGLERDPFGSCYIVRYVNKVATPLGTPFIVPADGQLHTYKLSIIPGSTNTIEASMDGIPLGQVADNVISLTSGQFPITLKGGTARHLKLNMATAHHTAMSAQTQKALDFSGNFKYNEFNPNAPSIVVNPQGGFSGVPSGGTMSYVTHPMSVGVCAQVKFHFVLGGTGSDFLCGILNHGFFTGGSTNGYGMRWNHATGDVSIVKWVAGVEVDLYTVTNKAMDMNIHSLALAVTSGTPNNTIEVSLDGNVLLKTDSSVSMVTGNWGVSLMDGSGGSAQFWHYEYRAQAPQYSELPAQIQAMMGPAPDGNGCYIVPASVFAQQIAGLTGSGSVSLDNIPDGNPTTGFARVAATDLTSGHVTTTYNTPFNNANVTLDSAGRYAKFPSVTLVSTNDLYPIKAAYKLVAEGMFKAGGTSNNVQLIWGDTNNGYMLQWQSSGVITINSWLGGSKTVQYTFANSVTMDGNPHWMALAVTPGATPGTNDTFAAIFDDQSSGPQTPGGSLVTWGSTAPVSVQTGGAGGQITHFRVRGALL